MMRITISSSTIVKPERRRNDNGYTSRMPIITEPHSAGCMGPTPKQRSRPEVTRDPGDRDAWVEHQNE